MINYAPKNALGSAGLFLLFMLLEGAITPNHGRNFVHDQEKDQHCKRTDSCCLNSPLICPRHPREILRRGADSTRNVKIKKIAGYRTTVSFVCACARV